MKKIADTLNPKLKKKLFRTAAAIVIALSAVPVRQGTVRSVLFVAAYLTVGTEVLRKAWKGLQKKQPFDENFLMAAASLGALFSGDIPESAAVMIFYEIGELFENIAVGRSRKNITELMNIRPDRVNLPMTDGGIISVDPDGVSIGTEIIVLPGEKVPIDGVIVKGRGSLNTAALTGESVPSDVGPGDEVLSGSVSVSSVLHIRTTKEFGDSTASRILELVENASSRKSRSENFISKFARIYTPAVCFSAVALAVLPPLIRLMTGTLPEWRVWIGRALSFLVISCPCALVISVPLTFFAALGGAGRAGVLIKGSNYMEPLSRVGCVVLDKTGTLTKGSFEVRGVYDNVLTDEELLRMAAKAEWGSVHPIARSIKRACGEAPDLTDVRNVTEFGGEGVTAEAGGKQIACGNEKLMHRLGISFTPSERPGTAVYVAIDGKYEGYLLISDQLKPTSSKAVAELAGAGIGIVLLTGDRQNAAEDAAEKLGIAKENTYSGLLPADKVEIVEKLLTDRQRGTLLFVGDGINDAPVLARADVGISMGSIGSDAAIEASDVVLMDDDPTKILTAIRIGKKCMRIVNENIVFAIGAKLVCLLLCALGIAGMGLAVFADTGVMVLTVCNAVRALRIKNDRGGI